MPDKEINVNSAHLKEAISKRNFEALIHPWFLPSGWNSRDYGIDGCVEIIKPIAGTLDYTVESKYFLVQMKSTDALHLVASNISVNIKVNHILHWYKSNLPVMLVINDLPTNGFYFQWIDDSLIQELENEKGNWINQTSVNLNIPVKNHFDLDSKDGIRRYIAVWKHPIRKFLEPGVFFNLKARVELINQQLNDLARRLPFHSIQEEITGIEQQLEKSIYRITVTGPSRVGKSTLINALIKRTEISPTGFFQTTGVPIHILPGKKEVMTVFFQSGPPKEYKLNPKNVKQFASQNENESNNKNVTLINIQIKNKLLERGVCFVDVPGLDDADENIFSTAWRTVLKSNAIVYVIDAAPAQTGGYLFKSDYKKHLLELSKSADRIFLVFNKIDALSKQTLQNLRDQVGKDIVKHHLSDLICEKVYFISAEKNDRKKATVALSDSTEDLEYGIWTYLLQHNTFGLKSLHTITKNIDSIRINYNALLNARLLNNVSSEKLQKVIRKTEQTIPSLQSDYTRLLTTQMENLSNSLQIRKEYIVKDLRNYLTLIPLQSELPNRQVIKQYLTASANKTIETTNKQFSMITNSLKNMLDEWIEANLKQVREVIIGKQKSRIVDFSGIESIDPPPIDFTTSASVGFSVGLITACLVPGMALITGLAAFVSNLLLNAADKREVRINKVMKEVSIKSDQLFKSISDAYSEALNYQATVHVDYANRKLRDFLQDLGKEIEALGSPLTDSQKSIYLNIIAATQDLQHNISQLEQDLTGWCDPAIK